jgi:hypothetical protein
MAAPLQAVRRRKARNAATDDRDVDGHDALGVLSATPKSPVTTASSRRRFFIARSPSGLETQAFFRRHFSLYCKIVKIRTSGLDVYQSPRGRQ